MQLGPWPARRSDVFTGVWRDSSYSRRVLASQSVIQSTGSPLQRSKTMLPKNNRLHTQVPRNALTSIQYRQCTTVNYEIYNRVEPTVYCTIHCSVLYNGKSLLPLFSDVTPWHLATTAWLCFTALCSNALHCTVLHCSTGSCNVLQ